jgi:CheY-like chemotaxis protein
LLPKSNAPALIDESSSHPFLPKCVLVVDDTPASLESARLTLEGLDAEVITARSGAEALDLVQGRAGIDAVIRDIMSPGSPSYS